MTMTMTMTTITSNYTEARFSKDDSALLLIDHQSASWSSTDTVLLIQLLHDSAAPGMEICFFRNWAKGSES